MVVWGMCLAGWLDVGPVWAQQAPASRPAARTQSSATKNTQNTPAKTKKIAAKKQKAAQKEQKAKKPIVAKAPKAATKGKKTPQVAKKGKKAPTLSPIVSRTPAAAPPKVTIPPGKTPTIDANKRIRRINAQNFVKNYWSKGPWMGFLLIIFAGFLVSLTPCVYPMIPVTIAVIGAANANEDKGRRNGLWLASMYVLGMALPYTALGVVVAVIGRQPIVLGASVFTNPWFLGGTVVLFGAMALSMFGLFDLSLPSSWQTRMAGVGGGNSSVGIMLLGVVGALLATPCSGPVIVGLLAFIAQLSADPAVSTLEGIAFGAALPFAFSVGVGIPFLVLGGGVVQALPRSGTWMTEVKKVFGVILLAAAFYYAYFLFRDYRAGYAAVLSVTMIALGLAAGAFRGFDKKGWWWDQAKQTFGILMLLVGGYQVIALLMINGFLVPPIKEITGSHKVKVKVIRVPQVQQISAKGGVKLNANVAVVTKPDPCLPPADHPADKPFWFKDEKKGMACAKKLKRPVIIDFWAEWCAACKKLEKKSFNKPSVVQESRRFIMIKYEYNMTSPEDKRLQKKYTIGSLPLVSFVNSSGKLLDQPRIIGFINHKKVLELMRQVR